MGQNEIHIGDIGTEFVATIKDSGAAINISGANTTTSRRFLFEKSNGSTSSETASFVTDGTDGKLSFTTSSGFLDIAGDWRLQAKIILNSATTNYSSIFGFRVHKNLE